MVVSLNNSNGLGWECDSMCRWYSGGEVESGDIQEAKWSYRESWKLRNYGSGDG